MGKTIEIPEGYEARIEGNKIILEPKESDDERIIKDIITALSIGVTCDESALYPEATTTLKEAIAYLERQKEQKPLSTEETELNSIAFLEHMGYTCIPPGKEQKPASGNSEKPNNHAEWSEEDNPYYDDIYEILINLLHSETADVNKDAVQKDLDWLESLRPRPKQEWKQENCKDLSEFECAMLHIGESFFGKNAGLNPNDTALVKEQAKLLIDLVECKSAEWSEEDVQRKIENAIYLIEHYASHGHDYNLREKIINGLKNLHPSWNPSLEFQRGADGGTERSR